MDRPDLADIQRYLDELDAERLEARRLLEDLADVEDSPETDAEILRRLRRAAATSDRCETC